MVEVIPMTEDLNKPIYTRNSMLFPFHSKKQQKIFGIMGTLIGIVLMLLNPVIPFISDYISSLALGIILALLSLLYLLEAISS